MSNQSHVLKKKFKYFLLCAEEHSYFFLDSKLPALCINYNVNKLIALINIQIKIVGIFLMNVELKNRLNSTKQINPINLLFILISYGSERPRFRFFLLSEIIFNKRYIT
jgi:hypothetical protein